MKYLKKNMNKKWFKIDKDAFGGEFPLTVTTKNKVVYTTEYSYNFYKTLSGDIENAIKKAIKKDEVAKLNRKNG